MTHAVIFSVRVDAHLRRSEEDLEAFPTVVHRPAETVLLTFTECFHPLLSTINPVVGLDIMFFIAHVCVVRSVWHWLNVVGHFDFVYVPVDCKRFASG